MDENVEHHSVSETADSGAIDARIKEEEVRDVLRQALEIIAVGDAPDPIRVATAALRSAGIWIADETPNHGSAVVCQLAELAVQQAARHGFASDIAFRDGVRDGVDQLAKVHHMSATEEDRVAACSGAERLWLDGQRKLEMTAVVATEPSRGAIRFYKPDPSGLHSPYVVLQASVEKMLVIEVGSRVVLEFDRSHWMNWQQMIALTESVALEVKDKSAGNLDDMRNRISRFLTLQQAVAAQGAMAEYFAEAKRQQPDLKI